MTLDEIMELGSVVADELSEHDRCRVEFHPGNGTRYDVSLTRRGPQVIRADRHGHVYGMDTVFEPGEVVTRWPEPELLFVAVLNFGTGYEVRAAPMPVYLAEKLTRGNLTDAAALHLLLAAVAGQAPSVSLDAAGIR